MDNDCPNLTNIEVNKVPKNLKNVYNKLCIKTLKDLNFSCNKSRDIDRILNVNNITKMTE